MKKRTFFWNIFIVVIMVFAAIIFAIKTDKLLEAKASRNDYYDFVHSSLNTDILFVGTSHMARAITPTKLWETNGYTSYVLKALGNGVQRDNAMLEMALDYTNPKLVVLDTEQYWRQDELDYQVKKYHMFSDSFPLSETKIRTTLELYEERSLREELLFPWLIYHNRWDRLGRGDFYPVDDSRCYKGNEYEAGIGKVELSKDVPKRENIEEVGDDGLPEIERFIQKCKDNNIEVLLVTLPYSVGDKERLYSMKIAELASKHGVIYIDFNEQEYFVDENTDFSNPEHLNISGARKVTEFFGSYISENYDVPDRRTEKEYSDKWNEDYRAYYELIKDKMIAETELKKLLVMCNEKAFNTSVYIDNTLQCQGDDTLQKLLDDNPTLHIIDKPAALSMVGEDGKESLEEKGIYIWIYDAQTGEKICEKFFQRTEDFLISGSGTEENE